MSPRRPCSWPPTPPPTAPARCWWLTAAGGCDWIRYGTTQEELTLLVLRPGVRGGPGLAAGVRRLPAGQLPEPAAGGGAAGAGGRGVAVRPPVHRARQGAAGPA